MAEEVINNTDNARQALKTSAPDIWFAINYAHAEDRPYYEAAHALRLSLHTAIFKEGYQGVREAPLGEIRLQWWREAISEVFNGHAARAHPTLQALQTVSQNILIVDLKAQSRIESAINQYAQLLYDAPFLSPEALFDWVSSTETVFHLLPLRWIGKEATIRHIEEGLSLYAMITRSWPNAQQLDNREVSEFIRKHYDSLRPSFKGIEQEIIPAALPVVLIKDYLNSDRSTVTTSSGLKRHLRYFAATALNKW